MDINEIFYAVILGVLEGLTEFLPVSSTGHLLIARDLMGFKAVEGNAFEISIQVGAILAVCVLYFKKLSGLALTLHTKKSRKFALAILIAFLPAVVVGFFLHETLQEEFFNIKSISISLIIGGIAIIVIENFFGKKPHIHTVDNINRRTALKIGIVQCFAMIPGTSRSGATIMGAMMAGVDRKAAAEFSFFLAIPTLIGASALSLYENWGSINNAGLHLILIGGVASFLTALIVVNKLVDFVSRNGFKPFAYYRILAGTLLLLYIS